MKIAFGHEGQNKKASGMNISLDQVIKSKQMKPKGNQNVFVNNRGPKQFQQQKQQQWNQQKQRQPQGNNPKQQQNFGKPAIMKRTGPLPTGPAKLVISNLHAKVTEADMFTLFKEFGEISQTSIHYDRQGKSIGSAHVVFKRYVDALKGLQRYNGITLDGRPMVIRIENMPGQQGQQKAFNITTQQGNNQGMGKKAVKRLQTAQKPLMGDRPMPQQQPNIRMPPSIQTPYGISKNYSFGVPPNFGMNMPSVNPNLKNAAEMVAMCVAQTAAAALQQQLKNANPAVRGPGGTGSFGGTAQPGVMGRLGGVGSYGSNNERNNQPVPSILQRLDGGFNLSNANVLNQPANRNVLSRLGGTNVKSVGNAAGSGSILNRVGPKKGNVQAGKPGSQPALLGQYPGHPGGGLMGGKWSFAIPGGKPVNPKTTGKPQNTKGPAKQQQPQQKKPVQQQQANKKKKFNQKPTPTAAELDAELDAYLREMNTNK